MSVLVQCLRPKSRTRGVWVQGNGDRLHDYRHLEPIVFLGGYALVDDTDPALPWFINSPDFTVLGDQPHPVADYPERISAYLRSLHWPPGPGGPFDPARVADPDSPAGKHPEGGHTPLMTSRGNAGISGTY